MSPYRDADWPPCPRCEARLPHDDEAALACGAGCGTWVPNAMMRLDPASLVGLARSSPTRSPAFPFSRCPTCKRSLTDLYAGRDTELALGQCLEHGVWIERGNLTLFESLFADEIRRQADARAAADAESARMREEQANLASLPPGVADLIQRVQRLERTVEELAHQLAALRAMDRS